MSGFGSVGNDNMFHDECCKRGYQLASLAICLLLFSATAEAWGVVAGLVRLKLERGGSRTCGPATVSRQRTSDLRSALHSHEKPQCLCNRPETAGSWNVFAGSYMAHARNHTSSYSSSEVNDRRKADNMVLHKPENKHVFKAFDLSGKVAAVTGGARGIGLEVSRGLAEAGANVRRNASR